MTTKYLFLVIICLMSMSFTKTVIAQNVSTPMSNVTNQRINDMQKKIASLQQRLEQFELTNNTRQNDISSIYTTSVDKMSTEYNCAVLKITMMISLFMGFLAIVSIIMAVLSYKFARQWISNTVENQLSSILKTRSEAIFVEMSRVVVDEERLKFDKLYNELTACYTDAIELSNAAKRRFENK